MTTERDDYRMHSLYRLAFDSQEQAAMRWYIRKICREEITKVLADALTTAKTRPSRKAP